MPLKPDVKAKWLAVLRSGEYTQGQRVLVEHLEDGTQKHCCPGVLCDIAEQESPTFAQTADYIEEQL